MEGYIFIYKKKSNDIGGDIPFICQVICHLNYLAPHIEASAR